MMTMRPSDLLQLEVDLIVSKQVTINADIRYKKLIRIEGRFEGSILAASQANLIITEEGHYLGDIGAVNMAYIDGKVEGNVSVNNLELGPNAFIYGNIFCKKLHMSGTSKLIGDMNVNPTNDIPMNNLPTGDDKEHLVIDDDQACDPAYDKAVTLDSQRNDNSNEPAPPARLKNILYIMEPQVDFVSGGKWNTGLQDGEASKVALEALSRFIQNQVDEIDKVVLMLDVHYKVLPLDVNFWQNQSGLHPSVGTVITQQEIDQGNWLPAQESYKEILAAYFPSNAGDEEESRHIIIQPRHCLIGTAGAAVASCLSEAITVWSNHHRRDVENIIANHNRESSMPAFDTESLFSVAEGFDRVLLAGAVQCHCHSYSLLSQLGKGLSSNQKTVLLLDATTATHLLEEHELAASATESNCTISSTIEAFQ